MRTALSLSLLLLLALSFGGCAKKKKAVDDGEGASTEAMADEGGATEEGGEDGEATADPGNVAPGNVAEEAAADQAAQAELTNRLRNLPTPSTSRATSPRRAISIAGFSC